MKKRLQPTLIAFIILIILLVYANYYEVDEILPPGMEKPQQIIPFPAEKIDLIAWQKSSSEALKVVRKNAVFKIVEPGEFEVEPLELDGITRHFAELKSEMVVAENATDTSAFGIDENSPRVKLAAGPDSVELFLGSKSPVGGSFYLSRDDRKTVFLVPGYIRGDFFKTIQDLRKRAVFADSFGNVMRIEISEGVQKLVLEKRDAIEWFLVEPEDTPADAEAIAGLIQALQTLKISRFVQDNPEKPEEWGFASPPFKISMINNSGQEFSIETGEFAGTETYFRRNEEKAIHAILNSDLQNLKKSFNDLRSKSLPDLQPSKITQIELKEATSTFLLELKDQNWVCNGKVVEKPLIESFFSFYEGARVAMFIEETAEQLNKNGLANLPACDSFSISYDGDARQFVMGSVEGINLALLHAGEILVVKSDLQSSFKKLLKSLRDGENNIVGTSED
jgi:hypothetical protein